MSDQTAAVTAKHGAEHAVPWPTPPIPGTSMFTFWGNGDQTTEAFVLHGDASVRIVAEKGPLTLRVLCPDGTDGAQISPVGGGMSLGMIPAGGTYTLDVRAPARWGVTVVFMTPPG